MIASSLQSYTRVFCHFVKEPLRLNPTCSHPYQRRSMPSSDTTEPSATPSRPSAHSRGEVAAGGAPVWFGDLGLTGSASRAARWKIEQGSDMWKSISVAGPIMAFHFPFSHYHNVYLFLHIMHLLQHLHLHAPH